MKNENGCKPYANKYVMMFIIFWLGALTGALALIMFRGTIGLEVQSSLFTSPLTNYQYFIPTPPGGIVAIPTPPGGIVAIPTPPGGITP